MPALAPRVCRAKAFTVLIMRLIISNLGADEPKLARYAATRFGVEPASDDG